MKKVSSRILAPVIALMMVLAMTVSGAFALDNWDTTTVGLNVATDVTEIGAYRTLNLTIQGLDELGNVDIFGVAGGSTIIASVTSLLGSVGTPTPNNIDGSNPKDAGVGTLAAVTRYITVNDGLGYAHITYPGSVSGTDTVTVKLYERRTDASGENVETRLIATNTTDITVEASAASASILNFESFDKASGDTSGNKAPEAKYSNPGSEAADVGFAPDTSAAAGSSARATVNVAGGVFTIKAYKVSTTGAYTLDTSAAGTVTVTLTGTGGAEPIGGNKSSTSTVYTTTGAMQEGVAQISMPTGWTEAGVYKLKAEMGSITSVPDKVSDGLNTVDYFSLVPGTTPASVSLSCDRKVVSNTNAENQKTTDGHDGFSFDPTFTASIVDTFGNKIAKSGNKSATIVKVTDANSKIADFNITVAAGANKGTTEEKDGSGFTAGLASLTASVPSNSSITASSAYALKIVSGSNQLVPGVAAGAQNTTAPAMIKDAQRVGDSFQFFIHGIGVDNVTQDGYATCGSEELASALVATDSIKVTCLATGASSTVGVKVGASTTINALFNTPISHSDATSKGFLIQDVGESYADFVVKATTGTSDFVVTKGSPNKAYVKDGSGNMVTNIVPLVNTSGEFEVKIDGAHVSMKDAYGNISNSGTLTITSSKGTNTGTITPGTSGTAVTLTYPANSTGTDTLTFNFTEPGVSSVNDGSGVTVTFPTVSALNKFETYPAEETQTMSVNGALPLTIVPTDENGSTVEQASGYFVDYDTAGLTLKKADGTNFTAGDNVDPANAGRQVFRVIAGTIPGTYDVTIRNIDGTITKTVQYTVKEYTVRLAPSESATEVTAGATKDISITGGTSPYTVASSDETVATVAITDSTATITGVAAGTATVTITDDNGDSVEVAVTVTASAVISPVPTGQNTAELTGDDIADSPVDLGDVVTGGDDMKFTLNFPAYEAAVDIYAAVALPDGSLLFVESDGKTLTTDLVPYATGVTDASSVTVFDSFPVCSPFGGATVPTGKWTVLSLVVPTNGGDFTTIDWTSGYDLEYYIFDVNCN